MTMTFLATTFMLRVFAFSFVRLHACMFFFVLQSGLCSLCCFGRFTYFRSHNVLIFSFFFGQRRDSSKLLPPFCPDQRNRQWARINHTPHTSIHPSFAYHLHTDTDTDTYPSHTHTHTYPMGKRNKQMAGRIGNAIVISIIEPIMKLQEENPDISSVDIVNKLKESRKHERTKKDILFQSVDKGTCSSSRGVGYGNAHSVNNC